MAAWSPWSRAQREADGHAAREGGQRAADNSDSDTRWAWRADPGSLVPDNTVGLELSAEGTMARGPVRARERFSAGAKQACWCIRQRPMQVTFAPQPLLAPEAGLLAMVEPGGLDVFGEQLAQWLHSMGQGCQAVDVEAFVQPLRERPALVSLRPGITAAMLAERCLRVQGDLLCDLGVRVTSLHRVDLYPQVNLPAQLAEARRRKTPSATHTPQTPSASAPLSGSAGTLPPNQGVGDQDAGAESNRPWAAVVAEDARAHRRLFTEVPRLWQKLARTWALSADDAVCTRQRELLAHLARVSAKLGRPVSLDQARLGGKLVDDVQRRWVASASRRAVQALARAWALADSLVPGQPPTPAQLHLAEQAMHQLVLEVDRRQGAWWELPA